MPTQLERSGATKDRLLAAARRLFTERGFASVSAEELVREAGLTRGALYHHFGGKEELFAALYLQLQEEISARIDTALRRVRDPWRRLRVDCLTFLESCLEPSVRRILYQDAYVALPYGKLRQIDEQYGLGDIKLHLQALMDAGDLARQPVEPLAYMIFGAITEAGLWISRSDDPPRALAEARRAFEVLIAGLKR